MMMMMIMMMIMMMNCFCSMVDWRKTFSLISSQDHCQRSSPSWISTTLHTGFEPAQNVTSGLVEWSYVVVITTTPWQRLLWEDYLDLKLYISVFIEIGFLFIFHNKLKIMKLYKEVIFMGKHLFIEGSRQVLLLLLFFII